jgi:mannose/fructose/N-acetylgalactosamine-specific phosphotransferase system component IIB
MALPWSCDQGIDTEKNTRLINIDIKQQKDLIKDYRDAHTATQSMIILTDLKEIFMLVCKHLQISSLGIGGLRFGSRVGHGRWPCKASRSSDGS